MKMKGIRRICDCGCGTADEDWAHVEVRLPYPDVGEWIEISETGGLDVHTFSSWQCVGRWLEATELLGLALKGAYGDSGSTP